MKVPPVEIYSGQDRDNDPSKPSPDVGGDLTAVVAATAENGQYGFA